MHPSPRPETPAGPVAALPRRQPAQCPAPRPPPARRGTSGAQNVTRQKRGEMRQERNSTHTQQIRRRLHVRLPPHTHTHTCKPTGYRQYSTPVPLRQQPRLGCRLGPRSLWPPRTTRPGARAAYGCWQGGEWPHPTQAWRSAALKLAERAATHRCRETPANEAGATVTAQSMHPAHLGPRASPPPPRPSGSSLSLPEPLKSPTSCAESSSLSKYDPGSDTASTSTSEQHGGGVGGGDNS